MPSKEPLLRLAAGQHALFTTAQAREAGVTARQLERGCGSGQWRRVYRGVYRVAGAPPTDEQRLLAAVLACGPGAVASHGGAAWLWGLCAGVRLEVTAPLRRSPAAHVTVHHRPGPIRAVVRRGVPCTDPLRTVLDLAGAGDEAQVEEATDRGVAGGLFTVSAVAAALGRDGGRGVRGAGVLRRVLDRRLDAGAGRTSALESAMDRLVVRRRLPAPVRQHRLGRYRLDYAWPDARVAVEVDGYGPHSSREAFQDDRARQNVLVLAGWTVLRFTWADLRDRPDAVAAAVRRALGASRPA